MLYVTFMNAAAFLLPASATTVTISPALRGESEDTVSVAPSSVTPYAPKASASSATSTTAVITTALFVFTFIFAPLDLFVSFTSLSGCPKVFYLITLISPACKSSSSLW